MSLENIGFIIEVIAAFITIVEYVRNNKTARNISFWIFVGIALLLGLSYFGLLPTPYKGVSKNTEARYDNIVSSEKFYQTKFDGFDVTYPADVFCKVTNKDSELTFEAKDGSSLSYSKDNAFGSMEEIYSKEKEYIEENYFTIASEILPLTDSGTFIETGYSNGNEYDNYYLGRIIDDTLYVMYVKFKLYDDDINRHTAYITDSLYRSCSFNGGTKREIRSYEKFIETNGN